ncbi:MAG: HEAT repeat domain-containing protein [Planctomycetes bacterium]|nr:HEAT repeat domain-containing protein [Planctomycetota bacterium]
MSNAKTGSRLLFLALLLTGCTEDGSTLPPAIRQQVEQMSGVAGSSHESSDATRTSSASNFSIPMRDEWTMQQTVADALRRIGAAAVPDLVRSLNDRDPEMRFRAAEILGRMGSEAKEAVPDLVAHIDDPELRVRKAAIRALGQIGPASSPAVPALIRVLRDEASAAGAD